LRNCVDTTTPAELLISEISPTLFDPRFAAPVPKKEDSPSNSNENGDTEAESLRTPCPFNGRPLIRHQKEKTPNNRAIVIGRESEFNLIVASAI